VDAGDERRLGTDHGGDAGDVDRAVGEGGHRPREEGDESGPAPPPAGVTSDPRPLTPHRAPCRGAAITADRGLGPRPQRVRAEPPHPGRQPAPDGVVFHRRDEDIAPGGQRRGPVNRPWRRGEDEVAGADASGRRPIRRRARPRATPRGRGRRRRGRRCRRRRSSPPPPPRPRRASGARWTRGRSRGSGGSFLLVGRPDPVGLEFAVERGAVDAEAVGRLGAAARTRRGRGARARSTSGFARGFLGVARPARARQGAVDRPSRAKSPPPPMKFDSSRRSRAGLRRERGQRTAGRP
jgi:hypothetical protein